MGKIAIHRKKELIYSLMKFYVILNGNKIGSLKTGEKIDLEIKNGDYELFIKGGFFVTSNSVNFNLEDNETKEFIAESFKNGFASNYIKLSQL